MSLLVQCFLRLPTCLRRHALSLAALPQKPSCIQKEFARVAGRRSFASTSRCFAEGRSRPKFTTPALVKARPPTVRTRAPPAAGSASGLDARSTAYMEKLFAANESILLYRAPNHTSFYVLSYLCGSLLLFGAWNWAYLELRGGMPEKDSNLVRKRRWYITATSLLSCAMGVLFGTIFILGPLRLIRTITAKAPAPGVSGPFTLRCEVKSPLPFMKPSIIETTPSQAFLNRQISAMENIPFTSIEPSQAQAFTSAPATSKPTKSPGVILRPWDALRRDTRRMFYRDGIARLRFGPSDTCKLDIQGCQVVDYGVPLEMLTKPDYNLGFGPIAWVRRQFNL